MKILFLTDNFPPEVNAPATRTYEHCKEWVKAGAEVTVITCFPNFPQGKVYSGYKNKWKQTEWMDGIKVVRVWSYMAPNKGFGKRLLDFNSFAVTAFLTGLFINKDVVISTSPQFFTSFTGYFLSRSKKIKWLFEIRDLWPESLWMLDRNSLTYKIFSWFEYFFYKKADKIIVVTQSFKNTLIENGISKEKISVFYNGSDFEQIPIKESQIASIKNELQLKDKIIIGYIGTFGVAQNLPFFLNLAEIIYKKFPKIHFLFIGDGADKETMIKIVEDKKLQNVSILAPIPKKLVNQYLGIIDFGLVPLRDNKVYHKVIPSKIFELAAMKKPILLGVEGEVKTIVEKYKIGIPFKPEDKDDFIMQIGLLLKLEQDNMQYDDFCSNFNRKKIALNFLQLLKDINNGKS